MNEMNMQQQLSLPDNYKHKMITKEITIIPCDEI